jgi:hypothetical protein
MRRQFLLSIFFIPAMLLAAGQGQYSKPNAGPTVTQLSQVQRIYVEPLTGSAAAQALRELIIASLNSTKLFVLTDNPDRADVTLKGAGDDKTFEDTFDTDRSLGGRSGAGIYGLAGRSTRSTGGGGYGAESTSERESHRIKERKHEAYATVRLCNNVGDVIWSTTQESPGAKFRGASADVATKIARQLTIDFDAARHVAAPAGTSLIRP